jgi:hypothetical protein
MSIYPLKPLLRIRRGVLWDFSRKQQSMQRVMMDTSLLVNVLIAKKLSQLVSLAIEIWVMET